MDTHEAAEGTGAEGETPSDGDTEGDGEEVRIM